MAAPAAPTVTAQQRTRRTKQLILTQTYMELQSETEVVATAAGAAETAAEKRAGRAALPAGPQLQG